MKRNTELALLKELLDLEHRNMAFLDDRATSSPVASYYDQERFKQEHDKIFLHVAQPLLHSSELASENSFATRTLAQQPVLVTRDDAGRVRAFFNICRHRGTRLVNESEGCKKRFTCPYHAWTWNNNGHLVAVPHQTQGFPNLDRDEFPLKSLPCEERHGFIWVTPEETVTPKAAESIDVLGEELDWFNAQQHKLLHTETLSYAANWKILVEGGLEAYHFKVAHRKTIAPYFLDNLSSYQMLGPHIRSILAKASLKSLQETEENKWRLRDHAQVLYSVFPLNSFLVQPDHFTWIQLKPVSVDRTQVYIHTLAPENRCSSEGDLAHWHKNHQISVETLKEDFEIGESIQSGLQSGANQSLMFGRFEGALAKFNQQINQLLI